MVYLINVTPCVGVWIETNNLIHQRQYYDVTPCVGVWIETVPERKQYAYIKVTPCVGVWIETPVPDFPNFCLCHTLRGCVD